MGRGSETPIQFILVFIDHKSNAPNSTMRLQRFQKMKRLTSRETTRLLYVVSTVRAEQEKFWEYHDILFTESPKLSPDHLKRYAAQV